MTYDIQHVEDSFALLRSLPTASVDVIYTDPPYSAHVQKNLISGTAVKQWIAGGACGGIPRIELPFAPLEDWGFVAEMVRVAKRWVVVYSALEDFGLIRHIVGGQRPAGAWVRGAIWYKPNSKGQLTGDRPAAAYEGVALLHRPEVKLQWNGRGSYAYWQADSDEFPSEEASYVCNGTRGEPERHPNQKPLKLCLEHVAKFSNRGETILDLFCGSGRIGEAAVALGRNYIGLDLPPGERTGGKDWVEIARARVEAATQYDLTDESCLRLCAAPNPWPAKPSVSSSSGRGQQTSPPRARVAP